MRGAIVLAGGPSRRMGRPKALVRFRGEPLVAHVVRAATEVVDEVVVVGRGTTVSLMDRVVGGEARVIRDRRRARTPLVGLLAGASALRSEYVVALGCDLPLLVPRVLDRLFLLARGRDATIPRWPNGNVEPLVAVYRRSALLAATDAALAAGERSNQSMIGRLRDVRWVRVATFASLDPGLRSFINVNTRADLRRAMRLWGSNDARRA